MIVTDNFDYLLIIMPRRIIIFAYLALIISMAAATFLEKQHGTAFTHSHIYGSWWFCALWALLALFGVAWIVKRRMRNACLIVLHAALVAILAGALLTHLTSKSGIIHLREGETADTFLAVDSKGGSSIDRLPFAVTLDEFTITYHSGTTSAADYLSRLTVAQGTDTVSTTVSMNDIYAHGGVRLYQSSYDDDGHGSYLSVNIDPWGIPVTYTGYAMLFLALIGMLVDPKGAFRRLLRHPLLRQGAMLITAFLFAGTATAATSDAPDARTLSREEATKLGQLFMEHNGRICQLQTYAYDFTKKLCGKRHYGDYSPEQVLAGFIFYGEEWCRQPLIKVKSGSLREHLHLQSRTSFDSFFDHGTYLLGPLLKDYYQGHDDALHRDAADMDDRLQMIVQLRQGSSLRLSPFQPADASLPLTWYAPTDKLPEQMEDERKEYIQNIFSILYKETLTSNSARLEEGITKMRRYQATYGAASIPSPTRTWAERLYNKIPFATILFMVNLTMTVVSLFARRLSLAVPVASALALTFCIALRWIISGTVPLSNGYETMLLMAWFTEWLAVVLARHIPIMVTFGLLMSGLFLLVSHIGQMNPSITHIMPVLNSPLLSIHVSIIMLAYALLCLTFACGVTAFVRPAKAEYLHVLSQLFLHPSLAALGIGIFTGAIWANVSWGNYWSWDPKETWALITLMVYAAAAHHGSLPWLRKPSHYHLYMVVAFLTLLMTYFGVNYFLGGMHSYA